MDRRAFLTAAACAALTPALARAATPYTAGLVQKHLGQGDVVFLDFKASWCSTCAAQTRVLDALKAENPAYTQKITFIDVDWDEHGQSALSRQLKIPRRSTLVVLQGERELGRLVAQTGREQIKALMDVALGAAGV